MAYAPMTELEAVNKMLKAIGEQPVNAIPTTGISEASLARDKLHEVSRSIQEKGLNCNTEYEFPLAASETGEVVVPTNALNVDPSDISKNYVRRGNRLYDLDDHTFIIGETIDVDIVFFLPWTDLPSHVRTFIAIRAVRQFQADIVGSRELDGFTQRDERMAEADFDRREIKNKDLGMLDNPEVAYKLRRRW